MLWFDYCNDRPGATIISNGMVLYCNDAMAGRQHDVSDAARCAQRNPGRQGQARARVGPSQGINASMHFDVH